MSQRHVPVLSALALAVLALVLSAPAAGAKPKPRCDGRVATKVGTAHADTIVGTRGADVIVAGAGNDHVSGGGGNDLICGGAGNDRISGGAGNDHCFGGPGRDSCDGGSPGGRAASPADGDTCERDVENRVGCAVFPVSYRVVSLDERYDHTNDNPVGDSGCVQHYEVHWTAQAVPAASSVRATLDVYYFDTRGRRILTFSAARIPVIATLTSGRAYGTGCGDSPPCTYSTPPLPMMSSVSTSGDPTSPDPMSLDWSYGFSGIGCPNQQDSFFGPSPALFVNGEDGDGVRNVPASTFAGTTVVLRHSGAVHAPGLDHTSTMTLVLRRV